MRKRSTFRRKNESVHPDYQSWTTELGRRQKARQKLGLKGDALPAANIGHRHPDYGMTPEEHAVNSAARHAAEAKQIRLDMVRGGRR